jgi:4'-phosphopantetheinyl transferase
MIPVWWVDLDDPRALLRADRLRLLSGAERARADRFRFEKHRARWLAGRIALRHVLADALGTDAGSIAYAVGPHGKPSLTGDHAGALGFNLSHSGGCALIAVATSTELGVDIEEIHPMEDLRDVAERHFAAEERERLFSLPEDEQVPCFYRIWTRKEAYIKAIGTGLGHPLDRFAVSDEPNRCRFLHLDGDDRAAARWSLLHLDPPDTHLSGDRCFVGALAVERVGVSVGSRWFEWSE